MANYAAVKKLSPLKWMAGVLVFLVVVISCAGFGLWLAPASQPATAPPDLISSIALMFIGVVVATLGASLYVVVLATHALTFRFDRPFFRGFGAKLWVFNLIIGLLLQAGFAFVVAPTLTTALTTVLPPELSRIAGFLLPFFAAQVFIIWFNIWAPLESSIIARRLSASGIAKLDLDRGSYIGISDPSKSSLKKLTLVEEDLGMLWIEPDHLTYRGDAISFTLLPTHVIAIERKADVGSVSSYFGAVHVIIHYIDEQRREHRVRLHTEGDWTLTGKARALSELADRLTTWKLSQGCQGSMTTSSTLHHIQFSPG